MIIKSADDKEASTEGLHSLLRRRDLTTDTKRRIEQEIRTFEAGIRGEREAAYHIDSNLGESKNWAVIHDLRLIYRDQVAQIDHVFVNRFLELWVCETKHFSECLEINEHGECFATYRGKSVGVSSPFAQNRQHINFLNKYFNLGLIKLPTRLGFPMKPSIKSLVLVSGRAKILRPRSKVSGLNTLMKSEEFTAFLDAEIDRIGNPLVVAKVIGTDCMKTFARALAAAHCPGSMDWAKRFGLPSKLFNEPNRPRCVQCREPVSDRVLSYCRAHAARFAGEVYCYECQRGTSPRQLAKRPPSDAAVPAKP